MEGRSGQVRQYLAMAAIVTVIILAAAVAGFTAAMASLHAQQDAGKDGSVRQSSHAVTGPAAGGLPMG